eukprot:843861-Rhodomonas_salina.2
MIISAVHWFEETGSHGYVAVRTCVDSMFASCFRSTCMYLFNFSFQHSIFFHLLSLLHDKSSCVKVGKLGGKCRAKEIRTHLTISRSAAHCSCCANELHHGIILQMLLFLPLLHVYANESI